MNKNSFSIKNRIRSFGFAINGLKTLLINEHNSRIHLLAAISAIIAGIILKITVIDWIAIVFAIGFVFVTEIINTALENIADFVSPQQNAKIKTIKDLAAAGVLISAITAMAIGSIVFIPKIIALCYTS